MVTVEVPGPQQGEAAARAASQRRPHAAAIAVVLGVQALVYLLVAFHPSSWAYLDYVDGYYLYVARRMAQGAVLYSGVMGVQPPLFYLVGDALFRLHDSLATARLYAALLHVATSLLVYVAGRRLFGSRGQALLAATLYNLAPYSLVWSRIFDPNPLVTFLSLASFTLLLSQSRASAAAAGVAGGLALATKIWYLPVGALLAISLAPHPRVLSAFLGGFLVVVGLTAVLGTASAGHAFWHGLLVQEASPASGAWLEASAVHVMVDDLALLVLAAVGARRMLIGRAGRDHPLLWFLVGSCCVLGATIKTGTAWPVFQFAEPALALVGSQALLTRGSGSPGGPVPRVPRLRAAIGLGFAALWALPAIQGASAPSDASVHAAVSMVQGRTYAGQQILAPPFYLYLAGRRAFGEYADINLWALQADRGDSASIALRRRAEEAIRARRIPIVLEDNRVRRLGAVPTLLAGYYRRLDFDDPVPSDRAVEIWVPSP